MNRPRLTPRLVWLFMAEGCNAEEVAAYAGLRLPVVVAMMANAARKYAGQQRKEVLHRKAA